jgi:hypothetical protein
MKRGWNDEDEETANQKLKMYLLSLIPGKLRSYTRGSVMER